MRFFILALDGLEYSLVVNWGLSELMQKKFGKIILSKEYYVTRSDLESEAPYTPIIWTSFITGKKPNEHDVKEMYVYKSRSIERIRLLPILKRIKNKRILLWFFYLKFPRLRKFMESKGIIPTVNKTSLPTIFDIVKPSYAIDVPGYNDRTELHAEQSVVLHMGKPTILNFVKFLWKSIRGKELEESFLNEWEEFIIKTFNDKTEKTINIIKSREWKLIMTYYDHLDLIGHFYIVSNIGKVKQWYIQFCELVKYLKDVIQDYIKDEYVFLIVSDHGIKPLPSGFGGHSEYTFWSINIDDQLLNPSDVTDFYKYVLTRLEST